MEGGTAAFGAWLSFAPFPTLPTAVVMDKWGFISNSLPVCVLFAHQQSALPAIPSRCECSFWHWRGEVWEKGDSGERFLLEPLGQQADWEQQSHPDVREEKSWDFAGRRACSKALGAEREEEWDGCELQRWSCREEQSHRTAGKAAGLSTRLCQLIQTTRAILTQEEHLHCPMLLLRTHCRDTSLSLQTKL